MARITLAGLLLLSALTVTPLGAEDRKDLYGDPIPAGAEVRLGTVRFRHASPMGLEFIDGGKTLISIAENGQACHWEVPTGRLKQQWNLGDEVFKRLRISPDGKVMGTLGFRFDEQEKQYYRSLQFFDLKSGERQSQISWVEPRGSEAVAFCYTPDGENIITGSTDGTLRVWERDQGVELLQEKVPDRDISAVAISPNGQQIAVTTRRAVFLWDWLDGNPPRKLETGIERPRDCDFSPDGAYLGLSGGSGDGIRVWDLKQGKMLKRMDAGINSYSNSLKWFPNSKWIAATAYDLNAILVSDVQTGRLIKKLDAGTDRPQVLAISPDEKRLAGAGWGSAVHVWDVESGKDLSAQWTGHLGSVNHLAFAERDGRRLAVTASDDGTVRVWDAATGEQLQLMRHEHWVRIADISPDGKLILSSSLDNTVRLWDAASGNEIYRLLGHGELGGQRTVAFTKDGSRFASWGDDWFLRVWDVRTGKALSESLIRPSGVNFPNAERNPDDPASIRQYDDDFRRMPARVELINGAEQLAIAMGSTIYLFDVSSGREIGILNSEEYQVHSLAVSPDEKQILTIGRGLKGTEIPLKNGGVRYEAARNYAVVLRELPGGNIVWKQLFPEGGPGDVAISPDGKYMAASLHDSYNEIRIWDVETKEQLGQIKNVPGISWRRSLAFSADGSRIGCGQSDTSVLIWNWKEHMAN